MLNEHQTKYSIFTLFMMSVYMCMHAEVFVSLAVRNHFKFTCHLLRAQCFTEEKKSLQPSVIVLKLFLLS